MDTFEIFYVSRVSILFLSIEERILSGYIFLLDDDVLTIVKEVDTSIGEGELSIDRERGRDRTRDILKGGIESLFQILILRFSTLISIVIDGDGFLTGEEELIILSIPESLMELIGCTRDLESTSIGLIRVYQLGREVMRLLHMEEESPIGMNPRVEILRSKEIGIEEESTLHNLICIDENPSSIHINTLYAIVRADEERLTGLIVSHTERKDREIPFESLELFRRGNDIQNTTFDRGILDILETPCRFGSYTISGIGQRSIFPQDTIELDVDIIPITQLNQQINMGFIFLGIKGSNFPISSPRFTGLIRMGWVTNFILLIPP